MSTQSSFSSSAVWGRRYGASTMSRQLYLLMVCAWTAAGIAFSAWMASLSENWQFTNTWLMLGFALGVLAVAITGTVIAQSSDSPVISAFGYLLVAGPFGLLLGPFVAMYESSSVVKVFILTSAVVFVLGLVGAIIPDDLSSWGVPLMGALLLLIGGMFLVPLLGFFGVPIDGAMTVIDWVALVIFGALVIYDLNRAVRLPHTMDNAIDSAVSIYLDFINIFIRLLSLMGNKK